MVLPDSVVCSSQKLRVICLSEQRESFPTKLLLSVSHIRLLTNEAKVSRGVTSFVRATSLPSYLVRWLPYPAAHASEALPRFLPLPLTKLNNFINNNTENRVNQT